MGRTYSCWMLNWWCITWPVGFKRLNAQYISHASTLTDSSIEITALNIMISLPTVTHRTPPPPPRLNNIIVPRSCALGKAFSRHAGQSELRFVKLNALTKLPCYGCCVMTRRCKRNSINRGQQHKDFQLLQCFLLPHFSIFLYDIILRSDSSDFFSI